MIPSPRPGPLGCLILLTGGFLLGCAGRFPSDGIFDWDGDTYGASDCDDADAAVNPGAVERCDDRNEIDEDCDGRIDDEDDGALDQRMFYRDEDGDGYGDRDSDEATAMGCSPPVGYAEKGTDCDDEDPLRNPGQPEVCDDDRIDEDCSGLADDDDPAVEGGSLFWTDDDGDGYGDPAASETRCHVDSETVDNDEDCDDTDPALNPGEDELCGDGVDNDCDGGADDADPDGADDATNWYDDADGDSYGSGSRTSACEGPAGQVADNTDCDDTDAGVNPAAAEVCGDGIDQDCDDAAGSCFLDVEERVVDADALVAGTAANEFFAWPLAAGGDVDGDGQEDAWAGTPELGGAVLVTGSLSGTDTHAARGLVRVEASADGDLGAALAGGADLDGDGLSDLVISSPTGDAGGRGWGKVYVLAGPVGDGTTELDAVASIVGDETYDRLGASLAVGDYDGDGASDLFASQPNDWTAVGFLGPFAHGTELSSAEYDVNAAGDYSSVLALGDMDGDGADELFVGRPDHFELYVYEGGSLGAFTEDDALLIVESYSSGDSLGFSVVAADYTGDGYADLIAGAPTATSSSGVVYMVDGPASGRVEYGDATLTLAGDETGAYFGFSLAVAGDCDDDGDVELFVGAPASDRRASGGGMVYMFDGGPYSGERDADTEATNIITGTVAGADAGTTLGAADLDGDGVPDLLVGGWDLTGTTDAGGVALFYGSGL